MGVPRNITQPAGKPPSGKSTDGMQGQGRAAKPIHQSSPVGSKPTKAIAGGKQASGATVSGVARGGQMEYSRNNPNRR